VGGWRGRVPRPRPGRPRALAARRGTRTPRLSLPGERLRRVCQSCGVDGVDEGAAALLAEGLTERLSGLLLSLRAAAEARANSHKELFGPGGCRV
jgi:hypothetical protein